MQFENRREKLLPRPLFLRRVARSLALGMMLVAVSLGVGMLGYRWLLGLSWMDSYVNAAMILSGMGPLDRADTPGAKLFTGTYALFSGFAVLAIAGVIFAPVVHRFLHYLHADPAGDRKGK